MPSKRKILGKPQPKPSNLLPPSTPRPGIMTQERVKKENKAKKQKKEQRRRDRTIGRIEGVFTQKYRYDEEMKRCRRDMEQWVRTANGPRQDAVPDHDTSGCIPLSSQPESSPFFGNARGHSPQKDTINEEPMDIDEVMMAPLTSFGVGHAHANSHSAQATSHRQNAFCDTPPSSPLSSLHSSLIVDDNATLGPLTQRDPLGTAGQKVASLGADVGTSESTLIGDKPSHEHTQDGTRTVQPSAQVERSTSHQQPTPGQQPPPSWQNIAIPPISSIAEGTPTPRTATSDCYQDSPSRSSRVETEKAGDTSEPVATPRTFSSQSSALSDYCADPPGWASFFGNEGNLVTQEQAITQYRKSSQNSALSDYYAELPGWSSFLEYHAATTTHERVSTQNPTSSLSSTMTEYRADPLGWAPFVENQATRVTRDQSPTQRPTASQGSTFSDYYPSSPPESSIFEDKETKSTHELSGPHPHAATQLRSAVQHHASGSLHNLTWQSTETNHPNVSSIQHMTTVQQATSVELAATGQQSMSVRKPTSYEQATSVQQNTMKEYSARPSFMRSACRRVHSNKAQQKEVNATAGPPPAGVPDSSIESYNSTPEWLNSEELIKHVDSRVPESPDGSKANQVSSEEEHQQGSLQPPRYLAHGVSLEDLIELVESPVDV